MAVSPTTFASSADSTERLLFVESAVFPQEVST